MDVPKSTCDSHKCFQTRGNVINRATNSSRRIITKHNEVTMKPLGGPASMHQDMGVTSPNIQGPVVSSKVGQADTKKESAKAKPVPKRRIVR